MRNYELILYLSQESQAANGLSGAAAIVQEHGGIISKEDMQRDHVGIVRFTMQPEKIADLKQSLAGFRHMLLVKPQRKIKEMPTIAKPALAAAEEPVEKVEIGEIDKKLEEIFKE
jgi:hypothetical protein